MKNRAWLAAGVGLATALTASADGLKNTPFSFLNDLAQNQQPMSPALEALVADLGSDDFAARERASAALATDESLTEAELASAARTAGLGAEQRERLIEAMRARFYRSERPALGIAMREAGPLGVVIDPQPNFPASDLLKSGDRLVSIDGIAVTAEEGDVYASQRAVRMCILSHLPGESMTLTLVRGDETVTVEAPLGRLADLLRGQENVDEILQPAWALRLTRLGLAPDEDEAIIALVPPEQWVRSVRGAYRAGPGMGLIAGGRAAVQPTAVQVAAGAVRPAVRFRGGDQPADMAEIAEQQRRAASARRAFFGPILQQLDSQIEQTRAALTRNDLPEAAIDRLRIQLSGLVAERQRLVQQMNGLPVGR